MGIKFNAGEQDLEAAIRRAGAKLLEHWPGAETRGELDIQKKSDGSVVTSADFASNEILVAALKKNFPKDGILSEEIPAGDELKKKSRVWIIDPLDGTQSFVDGNDDFSILVALTVDGSSEGGFMFFPARDQFAAAKRGAGAWRDGKRLRVSKSESIRPASVYARNFTPTDPEKAYGRWLDSGCAFLTLAEGTFDGLIIKIVSHREWDLAAPAIVVEESGGRVSDENGDPVSFKSSTFSGGPGSCRYFVASNGRCHDELLKLIPR